ncbi:hypothetical protein MKW94_015524 [Papaver nudicaule]|uniref:RRM domain-containing protein n=1 Tax=Papaver nudicaule TaxID=74823 RepID=A0AA41W336_PAPNU|nr:hypothetical protein [Papaver nudicaule]
MSVSKLRDKGTSPEEYAAFEEKVKRTVYIDDLSPQVTTAVLKTALEQFGIVKTVQFIPNYIEPKNIPQCALVEMQTEKQAKAIINEMSNYPFMMSGMPRPVRALAAEMEMFADRPAKPARRITCHWLEHTDPDYEVAQKLKQLTLQHAKEASYLLRVKLEDEEKLAMQQSDMLKANHKKLEMLENLMFDGSLRRLARRYNMNLADEAYF